MSLDPNGRQGAHMSTLKDAVSVEERRPGNSAVASEHGRAMVSESISEKKGPTPKSIKGWTTRRLTTSGLVLFAAMFSLACTIFYTDLGGQPLFNPDEALYAEPAREMLESGDFLTTHLNYTVRYTKPPLTMWAQAGAFKLFGVTEFAARFLSAACGAVMVGMLYLFMEKYISRRAALIACVALATAPLFMVAARLAITDVPLTLATAGSVMALFHGFQTKENRWKWLAYGLLGLGVMIKGPVAIVLPAGILGLYHLVAGSVKRAWSYYEPFSGLAVIAMIAIPWFAMEIYVTGGEYYHAFLVRENFQRFTGVVDHKYGWWYHPAALLGGFFPWTVFLVGIALSYSRKGIGAVRALLSNGQRLEGSGLPSRDEEAVGSHGYIAKLKAFRETLTSMDKKAQCLLLCACAVSFTLVFFSISVSKLLTYTLPAFPFLAALMAAELDRRFARGNRSPVLFGFFLLSIASLGGLLVPPLLAAKLRDCPPALLHIIPVAVSILAVTSGICLFASIKNGARALFAFAASFVLMLAAFGPQVQHVIAEEWEAPFIEFIEMADASGKQIILHGMRKPSSTFYAKRPVIKPESQFELITDLSKLESAYIIVRTRELDFISKLAGCRVMRQRGKYALVLWTNPGKPSPGEIVYKSGEPDK